jgi:PAS domain S-box-containing protein
LTYIRKDGSRFPAIVSVTALRDDQGAIIGYLLIGTDNSARKQVEAEQMKLDQRLRDQQFYTRSLIESNIDALMTTDPAGIITDVNKQMEALTGCTRDELIGAPFKNYFTDPERAEAGIKLVLREKKLTNYELTARARDGKTTVVSYNATTFYDRDRKLQGVFAAARDVTERKRLDQALQEQNVELKRARAAAEKANLAKSDFLSSMSHELRSPLNAILGFAQLINSDSPPPTPSQTESIDQILHAGWYLLELINEILDLAQIESGRLALSLEPTSLTEVMFECQAMIEPQGQKRGIKMTFPQFDVPLLCGCRSDPVEAGSHQPSFQRDQVQPGERNGRRGRGLRRAPGTRSRQRQGHRRGIASGHADAAFSAVQPSRTRAQQRGRHGHRPGDEQAAGGTDGRRDRRGEHCRVGQRFLVRTELGCRATTCS